MSKIIKMIGLDLDGTLLNSKKELTDYTRSVLEEVIAKGITVLVATGRPFSGVPDVLKRFPGMKYVLTANGARILDVEENKVVYQNLLSVERAEIVIDILKEHHAMHEFFVDGIGYMNEEGLQNVSEYFQDMYMAECLLNTRVPVQDVKSSLKKMNQQVDKLQGIFKSQTEKIQARKLLSNVEGIVVTDAMDNNLEINKEGTSKGIGLLKLGEMLGIDRESIMVCGDGRNDIEMLKMAGISVAMENGHESAKEVADYITSTNDEDGVAKAIERFVLKKRRKTVC